MSKYLNRLITLAVLAGWVQIATATPPNEDHSDSVRLPPAHAIVPQTIDRSLESIRFIGADDFDPIVIQAALAQSLDVFLSRDPAVSADRYVDSIRRAVRNGYRNAGYLNARVQTEVRDQRPVVIIEAGRRHDPPNVTAMWTNGEPLDPVRQTRFERLYEAADVKIEAKAVRQVASPVDASWNAPLYRDAASGISIDDNAPPWFRSIHCVIAKCDLMGLSAEPVGRVSDGVGGFGVTLNMTPTQFDRVLDQFEHQIANSPDADAKHSPIEIPVELADIPIDEGLNAVYSAYFDGPMDHCRVRLTSDRVFVHEIDVDCRRSRVTARAINRNGGKATAEIDPNQMSLVGPSRRGWRLPGVAATLTLGFDHDASKPNHPLRFVTGFKVHRRSGDADDKPVAAVTVHRAFWDYIFPSDQTRRSVAADFVDFESAKGFIRVGVKRPSFDMVVNHDGSKYQITGKFDDGTKPRRTVDDDVDRRSDVQWQSEVVRIDIVRQIAAHYFASTSSSDSSSGDSSSGDRVRFNPIRPAHATRDDLWFGAFSKFIDLQPDTRAGRLVAIFLASRRAADESLYERITAVTSESPDDPLALMLGAHMAARRRLYGLSLRMAESFQTIDDPVEAGRALLSDLGSVPQLDRMLRAVDLTSAASLALETIDFIGWTHSLNDAEWMTDLRSLAIADPSMTDLWFDRLVTDYVAPAIIERYRAPMQRIAEANRARMKK